MSTAVTLRIVQGFFTVHIVDVLLVKYKGTRTVCMKFLMDWEFGKLPAGLPELHFTLLQEFAAWVHRVTHPVVQDLL